MFWQESAEQLGGAHSCNHDVEGLIQKSKSFKIHTWHDDKESLIDGGVPTSNTPFFRVFSVAGPLVLC